MRFDDVNLTSANFFIAFQVCPFIIADFYLKIRNGLLKVHYSVNRLKLILIHSDKNYGGFNLKSLSYSRVIILNQTFTEFLMDLDCLSGKCVNFSFE